MEDGENVNIMNEHLCNYHNKAHYYVYKNILKRITRFCTLYNRLNEKNEGQRKKSSMMQEAALKGTYKGEQDCRQRK